MKTRIILHETKEGLTEESIKKLVFQIERLKVHNSVIKIWRIDFEHFLLEFDEFEENEEEPSRVS